MYKIFLFFDLPVILIKKSKILLQLKPSHTKNLSIFHRNISKNTESIF